MATLSSKTGIPAFLGLASGELNVCLNPIAQSDLTGWSAGTSHSVTRLTSGSPLDPAVTTAIRASCTTSAAESSTSGVAYTISSHPVGLKNKKLKVEFHMISPASASGVWKISVYSGATRMALTTDSSGSTTIPGGVTGKFTTYFDADSSSSYTVRLTQTGVAGASNLDITNVIVGPGIQPQGAVVGEWQSYPPTWANLSTQTNASGMWRRVGDSMEIMADVHIGAAGTAALVTMTLPSGYTVDSTKIVGGIGELTTVVGNGSWYDDSAVAERNLIVTTNIDSTKLDFRVGDGTAVRTLFGDETGVTDRIGMRALVPVSQWAGSGTVNLAQNDVEYAAGGTSSVTTEASTFVYGPNGAPMPSGSASGAFSKTVRFASPIQVTDQIRMEVRDTDSGKWVPIDNNVFGSIAYQLQTTTEYGVRMNPDTTGTDVVVTFQKYASPGTGGYGTDGNNWSAVTSLDRWRLVKSSGGQAVGFGHASATQSGVVNTTTQTFAGEKTFQTSTSNNAITYSSAGAVTLGPSGYQGAHTFNGGLKITGGSTAITSIGTIAANSAWGMYFRGIAAGSTAAFGFESGGSGGVIGSGTDAGTWTFGASSGGNANHTFQSGSATTIQVNSVDTTKNTYVQFNQGSASGYVGVASSSTPFVTGASARSLFITSAGYDTVFSGDNGTTIHGKMTSAGAWALGPTNATANYSAARHLIYGNLFVGAGDGSSTGNKQFSIGSNVRVASGARDGRFGSATSGSGILFHNTDLNTNPTLYVVANLAGDAVSTDAANIASATPTGSWTFYTTVQPAMTLKTNATSSGFDMLYYRDGSNDLCGYVTINATANTTSYTNSSDARLKTNYETFEALPIISAITPRKYERLSNPGVKEIGFIAQELQQHFPDGVVEGDPNDASVKPWGVDYGRITPLLLKAIQEQQALIDSLKARIEALENA